MRDRIALAAFIILVVAGGSAIGVATAPGEWYAALEKPVFNPPDWIFAPVWTALYVLIAIAGWRVWRVAPRGQAMVAWWVQLLLNFAWSPVFFALQRPGLALAVIAMLLSAIVWFAIEARRKDPPAAWLFSPYLAWVAFATLLNASIVRLN